MSAASAFQTVKGHEVVQPRQVEIFDLFIVEKYSQKCHFKIKTWQYWY